MHSAFSRDLFPYFTSIQVKGGIITDDEQIISLYFSRDMRAVSETEKKYSAYLLKTAKNILRDGRDAEEAVSDVFARVWNSVPPDRPAHFGAYLSKAVRRAAIDRVRKNTAEKRAADTCAVSLEELAECIPSGSDPAKETEMNELAGFMDRFASTLSEEKRSVFMMRYFYFYSLKEISEATGFSVPKLKSMLMRLREDLKQKLITEGYE